MCLYKKSKIPRIAIKDIVVYKYLRSYDEELYTPVARAIVKVGKTYKGEFGINEYGVKENFVSSLFSNSIETGYIHSLSSPLGLYAYDYIAVKCIIPRGTLYFIGKHNDIASRKLKYVEIMKE